MTSYIKPAEVTSPKVHWHLFDVILDRGEGQCAYALGTWDGGRRIGFRWNGSKEIGQIGNPQSRGLPTWLMLDPALHDAVVDLLSPEKQALARRFLGLDSSAASRQEVLKNVREFHQTQIAKITSEDPQVPTLGGGLLVMHVVPFSTVSSSAPQNSEILKSSNKFLPIGVSIGQNRDSGIDRESMIIGSHAAGLDKRQRAYVRIFHSGKVEAVVSSLGRGRDRDRMPLPVIQAMIIKYAQNYAAALQSCGMAPPVAVIVSLVGVKGMRLLQDFDETAFTEDMPFQTLNENCIQFSTAIFETVPPGYNESAKALMPLLNDLAHTAGLPTPPYFDTDGNYLPKLL